jgi:hypothetical protein
MSGAHIVSADEQLAEPIPVREEAPGSLLARLRERAAEVARERSIDLPVPGWRGELVLRFQPLDVPALERLIARRGTNVEAGSGLNEAIDAVTRACTGVYARDDDELVQLADIDGPVRLEHRLAVLLAMPMPPDAELTAREVVLGLFGGNAFALGSYVDRLVSWMADPDATERPGEP